MKYALNLEPMKPGASGLPVVGYTVGNSNTRYLTLTYTRPISATDITYTAEVSSDLNLWNSGPVYTALLSVNNNSDGITQTVAVQSLLPINNTSRQFIRLKVTKP